SETQDDLCHTGEAAIIVSWTASETQDDPCHTGGARILVSGRADSRRDDLSHAGGARILAGLRSPLFPVRASRADVEPQILLRGCRPRARIPSPKGRRPRPE